MATPVDLADAQWLTEAEAAALLAEIAADDRPLHTQATRLRQSFSAGRVSLLLETVELRRRAAVKFSRADSMFFTRVGLQQATDEWTAQYKASRMAGRGRVADLCCGVGGDLIAIAGTTDAVGVDANGLVAELARANLAAYDAGAGSVRVEEATADGLTGFGAWHADPDRRSGGRRSTRVEMHSPDEAALSAMLAAQPNAAIKLAPGCDPPERWQAGCELQWLSRGGECRQLCVWSGTLAQTPGKRRATRLDRDGRVAGDYHSELQPPEQVRTTLGESVYEPDPAVLAAGLTDALASEHGLCRTERGVGYLTGAARSAAPLLTEFLVVDSFPFKRKTLAGYLRERSVGVLEIKHRGVSVDVGGLRGSLKLKGDNAATVILLPVGGKPVAAIVRRRVEGESVP